MGRVSLHRRRRTIRNIRGPGPRAAARACVPLCMKAPGPRQMRGPFLGARAYSHNDTPRRHAHGERKGRQHVARHLLTGIQQRQAAGMNILNQKNISTPS
ncbi:unnamed protein product [Amoebophrya sp. A120]|nr:unnamed protein product [Amoebophrya sp. A120]|eukprot:GSA120T00008521001.1